MLIPAFMPAHLQAPDIVCVTACNRVFHSIPTGH